MKHIIPGMALALMTSQAAADIKHGQQLHDASCVQCHDSGVYTREDRFISNRDALTTQVQRCNVNIGLQWFDEDVADVAEFLNTNYYQFK